MESTTMQRYPDNENVARAYQARLDGSVSRVEPPPLVAGNIMQGSAEVVSNVNDLLIYYQAVLTAWKHETRTNSKSTHRSKRSAPVCMKTYL